MVSPQLLPPQQEATAFLAIDKQAKRLESIQHLCDMQQELRSQSPFGTWWRALIRLLLYWVRLFRPTPPSTFFPCRYGVLLPQSKWFCLCLGRTLASWFPHYRYQSILNKKKIYSLALGLLYSQACNFSHINGELRLRRHHHHHHHPASILLSHTNIVTLSVCPLVRPSVNE